MYCVMGMQVTALTAGPRSWASQHLSIILHCMGLCIENVVGGLFCDVGQWCRQGILTPVGDYLKGRQDCVRQIILL